MAMIVVCLDLIVVFLTLDVHKVKFIDEGAVF